MQHGTQQERVADIVENVIDVLRGEKERHGWPVNDLILHLEVAHLIVTRDLKDARKSPFTTLRENPFEVEVQAYEGEDAPSKAPVTVTPGKYNSDDLDRIVVEKDRP